MDSNQDFDKAIINEQLLTPQYIEDQNDPTNPANNNNTQINILKKFDLERFEQTTRNIKSAIGFFLKKLRVPIEKKMKVLRKTIKLAFLNIKNGTESLENIKSMSFAVRRGGANSLTDDKPELIYKVIKENMDDKDFNLQAFKKKLLSLDFSKLTVELGNAGTLSKSAARYDTISNFLNTYLSCINNIIARFQEHPDITTIDELLYDELNVLNNMLITLHKAQEKEQQILAQKKEKEKELGYTEENIKLLDEPAKLIEEAIEKTQHDSSKLMMLQNKKEKGKEVKPENTAFNFLLALLTKGIIQNNDAFQDHLESLLNITPRGLFQLYREPSFAKILKVPEHEEPKQPEHKPKQIEGAKKEVDNPSETLQPKVTPMPITTKKPVKQEPVVKEKPVTFTIDETPVTIEIEEPKPTPPPANPTEKPSPATTGIDNTGNQTPPTNPSNNPLELVLRFFGPIGRTIQEAASAVFQWLVSWIQ